MTNRELFVMRYIMRSFTNRWIAEVPGISPRIVEGHRYARNKQGISNF